MLKRRRCLQKQRHCLQKQRHCLIFFFEPLSAMAENKEKFRFRLQNLEYSEKVPNFAALDRRRMTHGTAD